MTPQDFWPACGYALEGEPATREVPGVPMRLNQITTVTHEGAVRFMTDHQTRTAAVVLVVLERWWRSTTGKILLIVDQRRAQGTPEVLDWLADQPQRIEMYYRPRYAPELKATE